MNRRRKKLPAPGQCDSTGGASTTYMIHSTATIILPYIEQTAVYDMFDHKTDPIAAYAATPSGDAFKTPTGCLLHASPKGATTTIPLIRRGRSRRKRRSTRSFARPFRSRIWSGIRFTATAESITWCLPSRMSTAALALRRTACEPPHPVRPNGKPGRRSDARLRWRRLQSSHRRNQPHDSVDRRRRAGASRCERFTERTPRVSRLCRAPRIPSTCRAAPTGDACLPGPMPTRSATAIPGPAMRSAPVRKSRSLTTTPRRKAGRPSAAGRSTTAVPTMNRSRFTRAASMRPWATARSAFWLTASTAWS